MRNLTKYILSTFGGSIITKSEVENVCKRFGRDVNNTINFMISYGYLVRILRGLYYVKSLEEFKLRRALNVYKIISLGMEKLKIKWYFGLYSALRLNGLTHEFFGVTFILNDKIFRPKEIGIAGENVKFLKVKSTLLEFGIVSKNSIRFSDPEKTILDFVYIFRYRGVPEERIISIVEDYGRSLDKRKLRTYLKFYPKSVRRVLENAKLI
ncbi:MAG: type IV toxin-antitoxin system AbiEi family antitoxin domain-containing protein [Candidatus Baldrarchaeia archaeon]